ncbi:WW domain-containing protein [Pycnococcus provasolii]
MDGSFEPNREWNMKVDMGESITPKSMTQVPQSDVRRRAMLEAVEISREQAEKREALRQKNEAELRELEEEAKLVEEEAMRAEEERQALLNPKPTEETAGANANGNSAGEQSASGVDAGASEASQSEVSTETATAVGAVPEESESPTLEGDAAPEMKDSEPPRTEDMFAAAPETAQNPPESGAADSTVETTEAMPSEPAAEGMADPMPTTTEASHHPEPIPTPESPAAPTTNNEEVAASPATDAQVAPEIPLVHADELLDKPAEHPPAQDVAAATEPPEINKAASGDAAAAAAAVAEQEKQKRDLDEEEEERLERELAEKARAEEEAAEAKAAAAAAAAEEETRKAEEQAKIAKEEEERKRAEEEARIREQEEEERRKAEQAALEAEAAAMDEKPPLPPDWTEVPLSTPMNIYGHTYTEYYHNSRTGATQWDRPNAPARREEGAESVSTDAQQKGDSEPVPEEAATQEQASSVTADSSATAPPLQSTETITTEPPSSASPETGEVGEVVQQISTETTEALTTEPPPSTTAPPGSSEPVADPAPTEPVPTESVPTESVPTEPVPTEPVPTEPVPTEPDGSKEQQESGASEPEERNMAATETLTTTEIPSKTQDEVVDEAEKNESSQEKGVDATGSVSDAQGDVVPSDSVVFDETAKAAEVSGSNQAGDEAYDAYYAESLQANEPQANEPPSSSENAEVPSEPQGGQTTQSTHADKRHPCACVPYWSCAPPSMLLHGPPKTGAKALPPFPAFCSRPPPPAPDAESPCVLPLSPVSGFAGMPSTTACVILQAVASAARGASSATVGDSPPPLGVSALGPFQPILVSFLAMAAWRLLIGALRSDKDFADALTPAKQVGGAATVTPSGRDTGNVPMTAHPMATLHRRERGGAPALVPQPNFAPTTMDQQQQPSAQPPMIPMMPTADTGASGVPSIPMGLPNSPSGMLDKIAAAGGSASASPTAKEAELRRRGLAGNAGFGHATASADAPYAPEEIATADTTAASSDAASWAMDSGGFDAGGASSTPMVPSDLHAAALAAAGRAERARVACWDEAVQLHWHVAWQTAKVEAESAETPVAPVPPSEEEVRTSAESTYYTVLAEGKVDEARAGLVATCGWSEEEASSFMSQYSAAFASFLAALTGEADMSTGGASLGGGGAASSHPAMALAVAEDALSGLESRLVRAGVDSMDGEEGRPHAGRVMRLLHLGESAASLYKAADAAAKAVELHTNPASGEYVSAPS